MWLNLMPRLTNIRRQNLVRVAALDIHEKKLNCRWKFHIHFTTVILGGRRTCLLLQPPRHRCPPSWLLRTSSISPFSPGRDVSAKVSLVPRFVMSWCSGSGWVRGFDPRSGWEWDLGLSWEKFDDGGQAKVSQRGAYLEWRNRIIIQISICCCATTVLHT